MFEAIEEYIKRPLIERQNHLKLDESCIEIGGYDSREFRGLLAHFLRTTIPTKIRILLCHACNNHWCSNVYHLYWGTDSENIRDSYRSGRRSPWKKLICEHGLERAKEIARIRTLKAAQSRTREQNINAQKQLMLTQEEISKRIEIIESCNLYQKGWRQRAASKLEISVTQIRRFHQKYMIAAPTE